MKEKTSFILIYNKKSQIVIAFSKYIFTKINFYSITDDKKCNLPINNLQLSKTIIYPITERKKIFNNFLKKKHLLIILFLVNAMNPL